MQRISGDNKDVQYKIELYTTHGHVKEVLQPFTLEQAKAKLREMGEPYGARIKHIDG